ncbi:hypothetical protein GGI07_003045 [Coemansia sp. Benny D115]|nr:hypothetical protein GGI07_003045 [Coemansia sp. Benny D115]
MGSGVVGFPETVQAVLSHRFELKDSVCEYLVQWASDQEKTWEPSYNLTECGQALAQYWRQFIKENTLHSFLLPQGIKSPKKTSTKVTKGRSAVAKRAVAKIKGPEDRIAVAKRVQMNKQLDNVRARTVAKKPPARAKLSVGDEDDRENQVLVDDIFMAASSSNASTHRESEAASTSRPSLTVQRARKSTGGKLPTSL